MAFHLTNPLPFAYEPSRTLRIGRLENLIALLIVVGVVCFTLYRLNAPSAEAANAPAAAFASGRAMIHVQNIAQRPHPMGSAEHAVVRDYIVKELTTLGVNPEIKKAIIVSERSNTPVIAGTVENIIARVEGSSNTKAIMLTAHYDSVPTGPGASDDGTAVASMLETLRALKAGPALKNDVIFLFADGEEIDLLGAQAMVNDTQAVSDIGLVLNFEARGSSGPSLMFETSEGNERLIEEFAKAAPRPLTNSLLFEIYKRLPNDTDFSVYKQAGLPGANFAYINESTHYHTQIDNVAMLSESSLQHHGSYALALTRHFGNLTLPVSSNGNAVYFDVLSAFVIRYPVSRVAPLTVLVVALFATVCVFGFRRKHLTVSGIAFGFVALLLSMVGSALVVTLVWRVGGLFQGEYRAMTYGEIYNSRFYLFAFTALTLAITSSLYVLLGRKRSVSDLWTGALLWWLLFLLLTTFTMQGASYLFTWPLLFSLLALLIGFIWNPGETRSRKQLALVLAGTIPAIILFIPVIQILFVGLTVGSSALVMVVVALLFGLLVPHLKLISSMNKWLLPAASTGICLVFLVSAILTSHFDANHPKQDNVFYALQADTGQAVWASSKNRADEWTSQFFSSHAQLKDLPDFFPGGNWRFLTSEAPAEELTAPKIEMLSDNRSTVERTLRLRVTSTRQAPVISLYVDADAEVHGTHINSEVIKQTSSAGERAQGKTWSLRYFALPADGIELTLVSQSTQPISIKVVDQSYGLPFSSTATFRPRPESTIPAPVPLSNSTLVSKSFSF
jgi:Peptidase family M28